MNQPAYTDEGVNFTQIMVQVHNHTFTGKERDEETGYGYFGARYMDHELMTLWLSVDPMAYKYPGISPYAYCAWNPIKYVDPSGKTWETEDDKRKANQMVESSEKKIKELKLSQAELQETLKSNTLSESRRLNEEYKLSEIENQIELLSDFIKGNQCLILIHQ